MLLSCLGNSTQAGVRSPPVSFKSAWLLKLIFWRTFVACNCSGASARDQFRYLRKIHFRVQLWVEISVFFFGFQLRRPIFGPDVEPNILNFGFQFLGPKMYLFLEPKTEPFSGSKYIFNRGLNSRFHFWGQKWSQIWNPEMDQKSVQSWQIWHPKMGTNMAGILLGD